MFSACVPSYLKPTLTLAPYDLRSILPEGMNVLSGSVVTATLAVNLVQLVVAGFQYSYWLPKLTDHRAPKMLFALSNESIEAVAVFTTGLISHVSISAGVVVPKQWPEHRYYH